MPAAHLGQFAGFHIAPKARNQLPQHRPELRCLPRICLSSFLISRVVRSSLGAGRGSRQQEQDSRASHGRAWAARSSVGIKLLCFSKSRTIIHVSWSFFIRSNRREWQKRSFRLMFLQGRLTYEPTLLFPSIQFPCTSFSMNCNGKPSLFLLLAHEN